MAYKIGDTALIIESNGQSVLIVKELSFGVDGTDSAGDFITAAGGSVPNSFTLSDNFITNYFPFQFQGSTSGYSSAGLVPPTTNVIDKFPFSKDANASDVGDLTQNRQNVAGQSSRVSGYTSGGYGNLDTIDKFPFSSDGNASDVGNLTAGRNAVAGNSSSTSGYTTGGSTTGYPVTVSDVIDKFPISADENATDVGNLTVARRNVSGQSSSGHGYVAGGGPPNKNIIEKFPFSTDANSSDVGDLLTSGFSRSGQSSTTHGYASGGYPFPTSGAVIEKFPFASDGNSTDVGDTTVARATAAGQSSTGSGYMSGGYNLSNPSPPPPLLYIDVIEKFPFSTDANATDVGNLTQARYGLAGQQV